MSPQGAVLEGVRATVANRLAGDGDSWTSIFSRWLQLLSTRDPGVNSVVQVQQRHLQQPVDGGQHEPLHSPGNKLSFCRHSAMILSVQEAELRPGLFWVLEQIPGLIHR